VFTKRDEAAPDDIVEGQFRRDMPALIDPAGSQDGHGIGEVLPLIDEGADELLLGEQNHTVVE
jgi:hypothetical protein